jgi:hypothetical protein
LVCSADLGEADMSSLDLLLKIFVMSRCLFSFVTPLACAKSTHPLLSIPKTIVPMCSTCFPSMISRCGLSSIRRAAVLSGTFHAQLSLWNQVKSRAATLAATSSASVDEWAMLGYFDDMQWTGEPLTRKVTPVVEQRVPMHCARFESL